MNYKNLDELLWDDGPISDKTSINIFLCQYCDYCTVKTGEIEDHYYDKHVDDIKEYSEWDLWKAVFDRVDKGRRTFSMPKDVLISIAKEMNLISDAPVFNQK